jgi:D-amino-acid oxidase
MKVEECNVQNDRPVSKILIAGRSAERYLVIMKTGRIAVIGAGVSGITTALHLQSQGYTTVVLSEHRADSNLDRNLFPSFASLFPAACILPHSVTMPGLPEIFRQSQKVFADLASDPESGVRWQEHYELDVRPDMQVPEYTRVLAECHRYGESPSDLPFDDVLGRDLSGWVARVLFAEMPVYIRYLFRRYGVAGGRILTKKLSAFPDGCDAVVNCTGLQARTFAADDSLYPIRGHLVFLEGPDVPPLEGRVFSYNYQPWKDEYQDDLYFFPRSGKGGGWLLGGSRQVGVAGNDGEWEFGSAAFPEEILAINRKILLGLTGLDVEGYPQHRYAGYRPARRAGIRIEAVPGRPPVVHNYGHGGAGVALSWGCALRVEELLADL